MKKRNQSDKCKNIQNKLKTMQQMQAKNIKNNKHLNYKNINKLKQTNWNHLNKFKTNQKKSKNQTNKEIVNHTNATTF